MRAWRLRIAAIVGASALVAVSTMPTASASVAWGNPNWCTHTQSFGYGVIGMTIVRYKSAYSSNGQHRHRIDVTLKPYAGSDTATVSYSDTRAC